MSFITRPDGKPFAKPIYRFLHDEANSSLINANGNYLAAEKEFIIAPAAGEVFYLERMLISLSDTTNMSADTYGNSITITNPIQVQVRQGADTVLYSLTNTIGVSANADWGHFCYDVTLLDFGVGNQHLTARWTFSKAGQPLVLDGNQGMRLSVVMQDNLTGLLHHYFQVQGYEKEWLQV